MDDFSVYRMYLALKLHFTTDNYDVIQQKGKVRASKSAFNKRKDLFSIKKIAKTYSDEDVANFLVANFVSGDRWGGMFDSEAGKRFIDWKKRTESLSYLFSTDLDKILLEIEENGVKFQDIFTISKGQHPYIIKAYLRKTITIETLVILDRIIGFVDKFDKNILDEVIWPDISRLIKKYKPFLKIDLEKYDRTLRDKIKN
jgi:hypothetical protein